MIHFSLILHHNMDMKYANESFNMGMFYSPQASFKMGTDPKNTHPGIFILESPPPLPPGRGTGARGPGGMACVGFVSLLQSYARHEA